MTKSFLYSATIEDILKVYTEHSEGKSLPKLAKDYNISIESLRIVFGRNNLPILKFCKTPKYYFDKKEDYFDCIDNEEKAYLLGFIMADGSIDRSNTSKTPELRISIQSKDRNVLDILSQKICPSKPVIIRNKRKVNWKDTANFSVISEHLCSSLERWGVVPRKSYKDLNIPNINSDLIRHFIRGYFDGDGSIVKSIIKDNRNRLPYAYERFTVTFSGSHTLLIDINNFFVKEGIISKKVNRVKNKKHSCLVYASHIDLQKMFDILYKDSSIFLKRKYEKFAMLIPS